MGLAERRRARGDPAGGRRTRPGRRRPGAVAGRGTTPAGHVARHGARSSRAPAEPVLAVDDLVGHADAARRLVEWLELAFRRPELLTRLGGVARGSACSSRPRGRRQGDARAQRGRRRRRALRRARRARGRRARAARPPPGCTTSSGPPARRAPDAAGRPAADRRRRPAARHRPAAAGDARPRRPARGHRTRRTSRWSPPRRRAESVDPRLRAPDLADRELGLPAAGPAGAHRAAAAPAGRRADRRGHRPRRGRRAHARVRRRRPGRRPPGGRRGAPRCGRAGPASSSADRHRRGAARVTSRTCSTRSARCGPSRCRRRRPCRPAG